MKLAIAIILCACTRAQAAPSAPSCGPATFLTFEHGELAAVDWVERTQGRVHSHAVVNRAQIVDATIDVRADETAAHSSVTLSIAGDRGDPKKTVRDLGDGAIYWSPRLASSIEQAILRARVLGSPASTIPGASL